MIKTMLLSAGVVVFAVGCAGGQEGAGGKLRFGQVYQFPDAVDFSTSIAVGQKMSLGLQAVSKEGLLNDYAYLDGTLEVRDAKSKSIAVTRQEAGKFETVFPTAGTYTLIGDDKGVEDSLSVTAVTQAGIRLSKTTYLHGTGTDTSCKPAAAPEGKLPVLKSNQALTVYLVPQDAGGAPLLGLLDLKVSAIDAVATQNGGLSAGAFNVAPIKGGTATHGSITFTDAKTSQATTLELDFAPTLTEPCSG